ncbi:hypothetical protein Trydic_g22817 [Trypoxylus dichotomus]
MIGGEFGFNKSLNTAVYVFPHVDSGPKNGLPLVSLANKSAISFPLIPEWFGTYLSVALRQFRQSQPFVILQHHFVVKLDGSALSGSWLFDAISTASKLCA